MAAVGKRGVVAGVIVVLVAAACRQIVGIGDAPPGASSVDRGPSDEGGEASPGCGAFPWASGACAACMQSSCCAEGTACRGEAACGATFDCVAMCAPGDEACRAGCVAQGDEAVAALAACQSASCSGACGLACGGWGIVAGPQVPHIESLGGCTSCLTSSAACAALTACASSEGCVAARLCLRSCVSFDYDCQIGCGVTLAYTPPSDAGSYLSNTDLLAPCTGPCQPGTDWSCAGIAAWPVAKWPAVDVRFRLVTFGSSEPVAGATVKACAKSDNACTSPIGPITTADADGIVMMSVPTEPFPFDGYFDVSSPGYAPWLATFYPYLVESTPPLPAATIAQAIVTQSDLAGLCALVGASCDPSLGLIIALPTDCEGVGAPGVSFSGQGLGPSARPFYFSNGLPSADASATQGSSIPLGGFFDVTPGLVILTARDPAGAVVSSVTVQVRAGAVSAMDLVPSPP